MAGIDADIAALVETGQNLVAEFINKKDEINQKLNEAVAMAPALSRTFYVDSVVGDDDTGLGTSESPFRTLRKAVNAVPVRGFGLIRLANAKQYVIDATIDYSSKALYILSATTPSSEADKPEIVATAYVSSGYNLMYGFTTSTVHGSIIIQNCAVNVDDTNYDNELPDALNYAVILSSGIATGSSFYMNAITSDLGAEGAPLFGCHNGITQVTIFGSTFSSASGNVVATGTTGLALVSINSSTKDAGANWYSNAAHVLSNV